MKYASLLALTTVLACAQAPTARAEDAGEPIKILLIAGGCCHDYATQKGLLASGIEKRLKARVEVIYSEDRSTHPPLAIYGHPDYAKGYDLVIHDECAADIKDPAVIQGVLKPHRDGVPGVNLHCGMHSYRFGDYGKPVAPGADNAAWYEYLGLQTTGHGPQEPIAIAYVDPDHPITRGLEDWTTIKEELYNNIKIFDTAHPLARGRQVTKQKDGTEKTAETVVAWTSLYGKTRVFSTTIGHNNATVEDARYLDLVARGILWAVGKGDQFKK